MNYFQRLELWSDNYHPKWLDHSRIGLGLFLCNKAITFSMVEKLYKLIVCRCIMKVRAFVVIHEMNRKEISNDCRDF